MNRSDFSEMNRNRMRKMLLTQTDTDRPNSVLKTIVRNMLKEFEQRTVTRRSIRKSASSSNIPSETSAVTVEECMSLLTRSSNTDFSDILTGCTVYCDIMMEKHDRSFAVKIMLQTMGATISSELNDTVTHVIFRNGSKKTLDLAKKLHINVVSILWLEAVRRTKHRIPESLYEPIMGMTKDVIDMDQFCHSIEEEYKQVINEEVSQLNKSITSKENVPNGKEVFQNGDEIEIEFQSNVLHKTIFDELNRSASRLSNCESDQNRKSIKRKLDFGEPNPEILDKSNEQSNLDKSKKNDDSVVNGNVTMQQSVTTTTKKKMRKLYTPGQHNFTCMLDSPAATVRNPNVLSSKKTYVPPYMPKLTNYKFPSLKKLRPKPDEKLTRRPELLRKIAKPRKVLKDILANTSSESGSVKITPKKHISSSSKKKPLNKSLSKLNSGLTSTGKKTDCTYDANTCGHRSSDFMTPETINNTVKKSSEKDRKTKKIESIVVTNLPREQTVDVIKAVKILGHYQYENNVSDKTTHIITTGQRTKNLLLGFINGCWILNFKWIEESLKAKKWLAEDAFEMVDVNIAFRKRRIDRQLLDEPHNMNLFKNYKIFLGKVKNDSFREDLKMLINKCGEGCLVESPFDANVIIGKCDTHIKKATYVLESWIFDSIMATKTMLIRRIYLQKNV